MGVGRNEPCHCGSGRKYKKCCWSKDRRPSAENRLEPPESVREESRELEVDSHAASDHGDEPVDSDLTTALSVDSNELIDGPCPENADPKPDPIQEARDARWDEFDASDDFEGQTTLFLKTLDQPQLMDSGMAIEMLEVLRQGAEQHHTRNQFEILVRAFEERLPDLFAQSAACCVSWLIEARIADGRLDEVEPLALEIAQYAGDDIDVFNLVFDGLAYHCQLSTLLEMMRAAWPGVRDSDNVVSWGVDEFAETALRLEMLDYHEHAPSPRADDPKLIERLQIYADSVNHNFVTAFLDSVTGRTQQAGRAEESQAEWCQRLCFEFLGHLMREAGTSPGKAHLAADNLCTYLLQRLDGRVRNSPRLYAPGERPNRRKGKARRTQARCVHVLCPDRNTLDSFLGSQMDFLAPRYYTVAATMELIPRWLRFLQRRQLISAQEHAAVLDDLGRIQDQLLTLWQDFTADPTLHDAAVRAWQQAQPVSDGS